jgi:integrase
MNDQITETPTGTSPRSTPAKRSHAPKTAKVILTPKRIESLKKTKLAPGKRLVERDSVVPGLAVRVTERGHASFVFGARYPGFKNPTFREIGGCDAMSLEAARAKARLWIELLQKGTDPRDHAAKLEKEEARKRGNAFSAIVEEYISEKVIGDDPAHPLQRRSDIVARTLRNVFVAAWGNRPIAGIGRDDVFTIVKASKRRVKDGNRYRGGPAAARASLGTIKTFFKWSLNQNFGLERNVARDIEPGDLVGEKTSRSHDWSDDAIRALWNAAGRCEYPIREAYRLLMLTGLRLNEVCGARREEFDFRKGEWIIPAERMKGKNSGPKQARSFLVSLNPSMLRIIGDCPRFNDSNTGYLFSTRGGRAQFHIGSKVKKAIDALMLAELRKIATERGDDPRKVVLPKWVNHDIRRMVRTGLSALKIPLEVKESVLAHTKGGLIATYDMHEFKDEKAAALEAWAARLHAIVNPPAPDDGVLRPRFRRATS